MEKLDKGSSAAATQNHYSLAFKQTDDERLDGGGDGVNNSARHVKQ